MHGSDSVIRVKRPHRRLTHDDRVRIVNLRYGSVTDCTRKVRSIYYVAKELRLSHETVRRCLFNFETGGRNFTVFEKPSRKFSCISPSL